MKITAIYLFLMTSFSMLCFNLVYQEVALNFKQILFLALGFQFLNPLVEFICAFIKELLSK